MPPKEKNTTNTPTITASDIIDDTTTNKNNKKPVGNPKRQKIVKACKDCRRRKVKCDGATPCGTCRRSSIQCIFESTTPKRGTSKHYIESLENRLSVMEKAVNSLSGPTAQLVKEAVRRQEEQQQLQHQLHVSQDISSSSPVQPQLQSQQQQQDLYHPENRYMINEFGSPTYIQDISFLDNSNNNYRSYYSTQDSSQSTTSSSSPKSVNSQNSMLTSTRYSQQDELVKFYLTQIQPYFPLFVTSHFNQQYSIGEIPKILINAICALSCIFQQLEEHHAFYQRAMIMLDESIGRPSIHIVQTLLLLVKYKEYNSHHYFEKTKSLMARTIEMCKILKLYELNNNNIATATDPITETRKRTFCMVFTYNTLLCVEQGMTNDLLLSTITLDHFPSTFSDESTVDCQRFIVQFSTTLNNIHGHMFRISQRQEVQKETRDKEQIFEENLALFQLQVKIENDLMHLPTNLCLNNHNHKQNQQPPFPAEDILITVSPQTRLLHMLYHLNIILLHFHYSKFPLPQLPQQDMPVYPHGSLCAYSASYIVRLVEGLVCDPTQSYRYAPRGLQFVAHCMTSAFTVLQFETAIKSNSKVYLDEFQRCAHLTQQITSASPSDEMRSFSRELDLSLDVSLLKVSTTTPSTSPSPILKYPMVSSPMSTTSESSMPVMNKMRRNTISHRPQQQQQSQMVPPSLLQLSSTGLSQQFTNNMQQQHHPLHNIHATPLQHTNNMQMQPNASNSSSMVPPRQQHQMLRGSTQSCNDLRSLNRLHNNHNKISPPSPPMATQFTVNNSFTQHRKPVGSVISSSTASSCTQQPYRANNNNNNNSVRNVSPSALPYGKPTLYDTTPTMTQSSQFPRQQQQQVGKMKRIKKSSSIHGISNTYRQQQQQQQQYQLYQQQFQFQQQLNNLLSNNNSMLHRPYQPTFDDNRFVSEDDFSMNVDELNFLGNQHHYPTIDDQQQQRSEGHLL